MKRKININRPHLTSGEIAGRRDFQSILAAHGAAKPPHIRYKWAITGLASLVVITGAYLAIRLLAPTPDPITQTTAAVVQMDSANVDLPREPLVKPPLKGIDIPYTAYTVSGTEGGVIEHHTGSRITVPATAFVDENGTPVEGDVTIEYREFHNPAEIFVAGIPMTYDSAGTQYHFESAGMIDIQGHQDGKPVYIAAKAELEVEMRSHYDGEHYNLYELDTNEQGWVYRGRDVLTRVMAEPEMEEETRSLATANVAVEVDERASNDDPVRDSEDDLEPIVPTNADAQIVAGPERATTLSPRRNGSDTTVLVSQPGGKYYSAGYPDSMQNLFAEASRKLMEAKRESFTLSKPVRPTQLDKNEFHFSINVLPNEFPELEPYEDLKFQPTEPKRFKSEYTAVVWKDVNIRQGRKDGTYYVTFSRDMPEKEAIKNEKDKKRYSTSVQIPKVITLEVIPVLEFPNSMAAKKQYAKAFAAYEAKRQEIEDKRQFQQDVLDSLAQLHYYQGNGLSPEAFNAQAEEEEELLRWAMNQDTTGGFEDRFISRVSQIKASRLMRAFRINRFGIFNCDTPLSYPTGTSVLPAISDRETGKEIKLATPLYLVEKERNAIFTYSLYGSQKVAFNPKRNNILWAMTRDNKIAVFLGDDFDQVPKDAKHYDFGMKLVASDVKSLEDVERLFGI